MCLFKSLMRGIVHVVVCHALFMEVSSRVAEPSFYYYGATMAEAEIIIICNLGIYCAMTKIKYTDWSGKDIRKYKNEITVCKIQN